MITTRIIIAAVVLVLGLMLMAPSPAPAQNSGCLSLLNGDFICSPPNGGIETDMGGNIVCGPGQCVRNNNGKVECSAKPGGAVAVNSKSKVVCVGGCVPADIAYCVKPE